MDTNSLAQSKSLRSSASCILLVEDDPLTRERLEVLIEAAGFGVISVASCKEARDAVNAVVFPIMIIDRMLGDGDGLDLIKDLRRRCLPNRVFIMMLTALDTANDIAEGMKAGADDYLAKKTDDRELLDRISAAIRLVKLQVD